MPYEVHDTVNAYLAGKIDQWYFRTDGKGVVFVVNVSTPEEAKTILEKFPLGQAGLMAFDYIPLGPLSPLRIINDMVKCCIGWHAAGRDEAPGACRRRRSDFQRSPRASTRSSPQQNSWNAAP